MAVASADETVLQWDPFLVDYEGSVPSALCIGRLKADLKSIYTDPLPLIFVTPDENDITKIHALVSGPQYTPYEGGFFYIFIRIPPDYPIVPPHVKLMTTGNGTVRFNPNFYKNGKICLSILGTWTGPQWSVAQSLRSVLLSIQSLMNEKPYHNEPGFEMEKHFGDVIRYNDIIKHETLRVAVIGMLEGQVLLPDTLIHMMERTFLQFFDHYCDVIEENKYQDGRAMNDPMGQNKGMFSYKRLSQKIIGLQKKLSMKHATEK